MRAHTKVYTQHSIVPATTTSKAHTAISLLLLVALSACTTLASPSIATTPTPAPTFGAETPVATLIDPALVITAAATEYPPEKEAPAAAQNWSLEIPDSPEKCTNVIRNDSFENMELDITSLKKTIILKEWFLNNEIPQFGYSKDDVYNNRVFVRMANFTYSRPDQLPLPLTSCAKYGENYVFGAFFQIPNGPTIPIQVLSDIELRQLVFKHAGYEYNDALNNPAITTITSYNANKDGLNQEILSIYYSNQFPADMQQTDTAKLLDYLDTTYDFSKRINDLVNHYGENPTRDQETLDLLQQIIVPGNVGISEYK